MGQSHFLSTHTYVFFYIGVPILYILVTNRPVNSNRLFCISFKIQVAHPVTLFSPKQRSAAHLIATYPIKPLYFGVRILLIVGKKMFIRFADKTTTDLHMIFLHLIRSELSPVREFPGIFSCSWIINYVFYHSAFFQH